MAYFDPSFDVRRSAIKKRRILSSRVSVKLEDLGQQFFQRPILVGAFRVQLLQLLWLPGRYSTGRVRLATGETNRVLLETAQQFPASECASTHYAMAKFVWSGMFT